MKLIGVFICSICSRCSVSCWSRASLGSGMSHISAFHHESHTPTKPWTRSFRDKFPVEIWEITRDQIDSLCSMLNKNVHMVPSRHTVISEHVLQHSVQNRFWQNSRSGGSSYFLTTSNMCHFLLQPVKPIMYESVVRFLKLKWCKII